MKISFTSFLSWIPFPESHTSFFAGLLFYFGGTSHAFFWGKECLGGKLFKMLYNWKWLYSLCLYGSWVKDSRLEIISFIIFHLLLSFWSCYQTLMPFWPLNFCLKPLFTFQKLLGYPLTPTVLPWHGFIFNHCFRS